MAAKDATVLVLVDTAGIRHEVLEGQNKNISKSEWRKENIVLTYLVDSEATLNGSLSHDSSLDRLLVGKSSNSRADSLELLHLRAVSAFLLAGSNRSATGGVRVALVGGNTRVGLIGESRNKVKNIERREVSERFPICCHQSISDVHI